MCSTAPDSVLMFRKESTIGVIVIKKIFFSHETCIYLASVKRGGKGKEGGGVTQTLKDYQGVLYFLQCQ